MSQVLRRDDYLFLQALDLQTSGKLAGVLNANGCANWTVCPLCHVDDFTHVEGCRYIVPNPKAGSGDVHGVVVHNFPPAIKKVS